MKVIDFSAASVLDSSVDSAERGKALSFGLEIGGLAVHVNSSTPSFFQ